MLPTPAELSARAQPCKNFLSNAALVLGSSLVTLVLLFAIGEMALRAQYGALPTEVPARMKAYDEQRGWRLKPGHYAYFDVRAVRRVDISVNGIGLRNPAIAHTPAPAVERITLLGDSFVFGAPVSESHTIAGHLRALAGSSFEIVNAGVPGYGTGQQYRLVEELQAKGYRLGNKLVLFFFTNDIQDNLGLHYPTLTRNPAQPVFRIDSAGYLQQSSARRPAVHEQDGNGAGWLANSLFIHLVRYQLEVVIVSHPGILGMLEGLGFAPMLPRTPGIVAGWYGPQWEERWVATEGVLEYLVSKLRANAEGPELFLAFVPSPFQVHESFRRTIAASASRDLRYAAFLTDPDRPQRMLQAAARRLGVPFIDLTAALRTAAKDSVVYFPREGHFNEAGSAIAARMIHEHVIQNPTSPH